jgi:dihydrolipoamide dehydrogenase
MGGYVAAIRAGQLGLDAVLVESDRLGGTCLIRGCIPSKAVIHAADRFAGVTDAVGGNALGIALSEPPRLDLGRMVKWKDGIVDRLNKGVIGLLDRAKVRVARGWAVFSDAKTCRVETAEGVIDITAEHVLLATGSEPVPTAAQPAAPPRGQWASVLRGSPMSRARMEATPAS